MAVLNGERMHDTMERLLPGARSAALLWQGAAVLGGAALGAGQVYGGAAPFGLALVIGCPPSYCLAAALGTLAAGLAFQPMLLGVKLAVAAVAAAAVRRLIDGRPGAGALAGCLTLTAAQVLQIVLAGGLFNPGQTVTVGCTALLAAVFGWAFAHFPAREPRGVCLWLAVATACLQRCAVGPLAPGLALAAGAGLCAAIGGTLEQTAVLSIALAAAITASGPTLAYAALAVALGGLAASCLCPGERGRCAGVFAAGCTAGARRCQCAAAGGQCRGGRCGCAGCAGERAAQNFPAARAARADAGPGRGGAQALRRGGHAERHCRHGQRGLPAAAAAQGRDL